MAVALNHEPNQPKPPLRQVDMLTDLVPVTAWDVMAWPETQAFLARLGVPMNRQMHLTIVLGAEDELVEIRHGYQGVDYRSREGVRT